MTWTYACIAGCVILFAADVNEIVDLPVAEIDQLIELGHNTINKAEYRSVGLVDFWIEMRSEYPELYDKALRILLPFATSYLCETGFSALTTIKTKYRTRLSVEDDLRLCLYRLSPRFDKLRRDSSSGVALGPV